jgi:GntR family transcriptional regulator, negative regulator for fad regulon and positive regulator of fabA
METVSEHIERYIISAITNNKYKSGEYLPSERILAAEIDVNRCSLRTALKALEKDGWVQIQHGLPTQVMGFLDNCQITAAPQRIKYIDDELSKSLMNGACDSVFDIIQVLLNRELNKNPEDLIELLNGELNSLDSFIQYEISLAKKLIIRNHNKVYSLLMNQLLPLYESSALQCIDVTKREGRLQYYLGIKNSLIANQR